MLGCSVCQGTINELNLDLDKNEEALAKEVQKLLCEKRMKDGSSCICGQHKEVPSKEIPKELTYGEPTEATQGLKDFIGLSDDRPKAICGNSHEAATELEAFIGLSDEDGRLGVRALQDEFIQYGSLQDLENFYYICYGIARHEPDMPAHVKDDIKKVRAKSC